MNLNQLKTLILLAQTGSFSLTAQKLGLTQPAVSFQIQALEEQFGIKLVNRSNRRAELTLAGRFVYEFSQRTLRELAELQREIYELAGVIKGELLLGASTIPGTYFIPHLVGEFKKRYPEVQVALRIGDSQQVLFWLLNQEIDIGTVGFIAQRQQIEIIAIWKDHLQLIVPPDHPWAKQKVISAADLLKADFILREPGSGTRMVLEERLREKDIILNNFNVAMELGSTAATISAVEAGLGVTVASAWAAAASIELGRVVTVKIVDFDLTRDLYLIRRRTPLNLIAEKFSNFAATEQSLT